jgi:Icc-related predicted phosphoesterase
MSVTKIFFAADVHGSEICFRKFVNAGKVYKAKFIILGGDLTGKGIVPIVEEKSGILRVCYAGKEYTFKSKKEAQPLMEKIQNRGYYTYYTDTEELKKLETDPTSKDELFSHLMRKTLERWISIAEENLKDTDIKCFMLPGNDDHLDLDSLFLKSGIVVNPEGKVVEIDGHEMISTGYANITPWHCPRDISEDALREKIETMVSKVSDLKNCIFNFHCPPYGSGLDLAPELDEQLKPVLKAGEISMIPVGSKAVREAIEKHQPLLGLHGHIHESRGVVWIGRTLCLNPGSEYALGHLHGTIVNLDKDKVKGYLLVSG